MAGRSLNKVQLIGHLGKDPEVRFTASQIPVANFSLATNEYAGKDEESGEAKQRTEWHNIVAWGKKGEVAGQYLKKGSQCYIEGRLQTRTWDKPDGTKGYITEVVVDNFTGDLILLGGRGESGSGMPPAPSDADAPAYTKKAQLAQQAQEDDTDIPF